MRRGREGGNRRELACILKVNMKHRKDEEEEEAQKNRKGERNTKRKRWKGRKHE